MSQLESDQNEQKQAEMSQNNQQQEGILVSETLAKDVQQKRVESEPEESDSDSLASQSEPLLSRRLEDDKLKNILEATLMSVAKPMNIEQLMKLFEDDERPSASRIKKLLEQLQQDCEGRGIELKDIASGYRYQSRQEYSTWLSRLWEEKAAKYSRAYLETLALIAYRQPVTRAEIEDVRGVGVSSSIIKTMVEREWIRVVGHRDVPGRPSLYATTKQFLDYFNMKSLDELPSLAEIKDLEELNPELELPEPGYIDEANNQVAGRSEQPQKAEAINAENNQTDSETDEIDSPVDEIVQDAPEMDDIKQIASEFLESQESVSENFDSKNLDSETANAEITETNQSSLQHESKQESSEFEAVEFDQLGFEPDDEDNEDVEEDDSVQTETNKDVN